VWRSAALWLCLSATLLVTGCGAGAPIPAATTNSHAGGALNVLVGRAQTAFLWLPSGRTSARYPITALSPSRYTFDVAVRAPSSAVFKVVMYTWYGATLSVLDATRGHGCASSRRLTVCVLRFPLLPAQKAGRWSVIVSKRSERPTWVRVAVKFNKR
jgi:hypothetical protein